LKGKPTVACFLTVILLAAAIGLLNAESATANPVWQIYPWIGASYITINSDGSITPDLGLLSQNGSIYTLTGNISDYTIKIECSNIVFDGNGNIINVSEYTVPDEKGQMTTHNFESFGIYLGYPTKSTNVTIQNVEIISNWAAVYTLDNSNCTITGVTSRDNIDIHGDNNSITNNSTPITISRGSGNTVSQNNVTALVVSGEHNSIYLNNIFDKSPYISAENNFLDNGSVGNFWSNYRERYPNASEIGQTGIGDTPYIVEGRTSYYDSAQKDIVRVNITNADNYPLMNPYVVENAEPPQETVKETSLMPYAAAIATVAVTVSAISLIYYQKKRKAHISKIALP
jgi:hypothetical protein